MAHFAELNSDNKVLRVIVVNNNEILIDGVENEQKGIDFCKSLFGLNTTWVQTSYNDSFRKKFARIGDTYDLTKDKFISPQPYPSWSLDANDDWQAPISKPETYTQNLTFADGTPIKDFYYWNEENQSWVLAEGTQEEILPKVPE